jgi:SAM dependent carboxyl methyltransferase
LPGDLEHAARTARFHTFACAGQCSGGRFPIEAGEVVEHDGLVFADSRPGPTAGSKPTEIVYAQAMSGSHPTAMRGKGFYNENSQVQQIASAFALPLLVEAADTAPLPAGSGSFVVADYGSSQGRNSLLPMRTAVERIRRRDPNLPIQVFHNDLPDNDFTALFRTVATSEQSYLAGATGTFSYAVGRSFFERLFPDDYVRVGWSAIAAHWLSRSVPSASNHIWCPRNLPRRRPALGGARHRRNVARCGSAVRIEDPTVPCSPFALPMRQRECKPAASKDHDVTYPQKQGDLCDHRVSDRGQGHIVPARKWTSATLDRPWVLETLTIRWAGATS